MSRGIRFCFLCRTVPQRRRYPRTGQCPICPTDLTVLRIPELLSAHPIVAVVVVFGATILDVNTVGGLEGELKFVLPPVTVTLLVTGVDHAPSSSLTRKDMVWVPAEREEVEKVLAVERIPLMLDVHS